MTTADPALLDLPAFLRILRGERRTAMLIHGAPLAGKSRFARQLVKKMDGGYLDALEALSHRLDLSSMIDQFDPAALQQMILEFADAHPKDVIVVDELDFLFPLWGGDFAPFQTMVSNLHNPKRSAAFVFFAQTRPELETWKLETADRRSRVVDFETIRAL